MSNAQFDRLVESMPRIAEAVNAFSSEEVQRRAFDALYRTFMGQDEAVPLQSSTPPMDQLPSQPLADGADSDVELPGAETKGKPASEARRRTRKTGGRKWEAVRDIDFRPEGKQSFAELVEDKKPTSIDQKNVIAVYWLEQVLGLTEIGVGHVMAAYKVQHWREPSNLENSLQVTASREHWLQTKNMKAIETTPTGRNVVKHDMPIVKVKKT